MNEKESSYIDYEAFLSPSFSPSAFANTIVLGTNNPVDVPLDLSTPLSKVLFDAQEIDSKIDSLASEYSLPLLSYIRKQTTSSANITQVIDSQISGLNDSYKRLEKEILERYEIVEEVRSVCERLWITAKLGRSVIRCLQWGRQLELHLTEITESNSNTQGLKDNHVALVRCSNILLSLQELLSKNKEGEEGYGLERVEVIKALQNSVINSTEKLVLSKSQQIVREFSVPSQSSSIFPRVGEVKARITSALISLYLLSFTSPAVKNLEKWEPKYLVNTLQEYLQTALNTSLTSLSRALTTLPTLDRVLLEISARCQNIVILESILLETTPPSNVNLLLSFVPPENLLLPLLLRFETSSLPSWFWRTLASALSTKITEFVNKGGTSVRTLRNNKNSVRDAIQECVLNGSRVPGKMDTFENSKWEREVAVMVGSVTGPLAKGT